MEENNLYKFFKQSLEANFTTVRVLKETPETRISLLRHPASRQLFVLRDCAGSGEVYRKLREVACPYLPRVYETAEENGRLLVLEEYIQGDSLQSVLSHGTLEAGEVRRMALQLCEALWVLHSLGAVHRDVKPDNIILRVSDAVLIDFDASRLQKPEQSTDTVILGTAGFAAPEQYGLSQTDGRADLYSLGVVMNVMLTGEYPAVQLAGGRLGRVIRRCTMTNPDQRYRDALRLREAL